MRNWLAIVLFLSSLGCASSRWAEDDPDCAAKYSNQTGNWVRKAKQAGDARHLERKGGYYTSLSGRDEPFSLGGEVGKFYYPNPHVEGRTGLAGSVFGTEGWGFASLRT